MPADLMIILNVLLGGSLVICWIAVLVTMVRNRDWGRSVLSIFPVTAFIVGWFSVDRYQLRVVMTVWTVIAVVGRLLRCCFPELMG
jgi:hypothetical protein